MKISGNVYIRYIESEMESKGALVRIIMNLIPAIGILAYYKYFKMILYPPYS